MVGDSKLVSYATLADMIVAGVGFIAPASKTYVRAGDPAALDRGTATEVGYVAGRDAGVVPPGGAAGRSARPP